MTHALERTRWKTIPWGLLFSIVRVRPRSLLVWDEQERRERTIPRAVFDAAREQRKLVYLGLAKRRTA